MNDTPFYIAQVIPAPDGWIQQGSIDPGDEFWYARVGRPEVQVFPDENSGWVLMLGNSVTVSIHATPEAAFRAYEAYCCDFPQDVDEHGNLAHTECDFPMDAPPVGIVVGVRWNTFREQVAETVQRIRHSRKDNGPFTALYEDDLRALLASRHEGGRR